MKHFPSRYRNRTLDDLGVGERAACVAHAMLVEPSGDAYLDQHTAIEEDPTTAASPIIYVTRTSDTGCTVDVSQIGGHKWTPRPVGFQLYTYQLWTVDNLIFTAEDKK